MGTMRISNVVRRLSVLVLIVVPVVPSIIAAPSAQAATYTVYSCQTPTGAPASMDGWASASEVASLTTTINNCPAHGFALEMLPGRSHPSNDSANLNFHAPADTTIASYALWRSVALSAPYNYRYYELTGSGLVEHDGCYAAWSSCRGLGDPASPLDPGNVVGGVGSPTTSRLEVLLTCGEADNSSTACPASNPAATFTLYRADITLTDSNPPTLTEAPTGSLLTPRAQLTGVQSLTLSASDKGGGVYRAMLVVDGNVVTNQVLDTNGGRCAEPFTVAVPCKLAATGTLSLDTASLSDGSHSLRVVVTDATGTNTVNWGPVTIQTANGPCDPSPTANAARLHAAFALPRRAHGRRRTVSRGTVTLGYGRTVRVGGSLTTRQGAALAGQQVCVLTRPVMRNSGLRVARMLSTDAHGRFSYLAPAGASRRIYFVHRVAGGAVTTSVLDNVRARVTLHGSRRSLHNGQVLVLRGRLPGGPRPPGQLVALQAQRGRGWQTFGVTHTNRHGTFRYTYRFTRTLGVQRYVLRATVPQQPTYPYASGASKPLTVLVRG